MSDRAARIRERVSIVEVIGDVTALKRKGSVFFGCCPFHNEKTPSLAVDEAKQLYHCHGCGAGGDVIRFVEKHYNMTFNAALDFLGADKDARPQAPFNRSASVPVASWVSTDPPRAAFADEIGECDNVWVYKSPTGAPLFYIRRKNRAGGKKDYLPLSWGTLDGNEGYHQKHYRTPRPLYNLDRLARMNDREVIVVEGEKAADAAARLFPGSVATTWPGGASSGSKADWSPLAGRTVLLWPDADAPGVKAMDEIAGLLLDLGAKVRQAKVLDMRSGWDAADAEADGWDNAKVGAWLGTCTEDLKPIPVFDPPPPDPEPEPWLDHVPPAGQIIKALPVDPQSIVNGSREYPDWMAGLPNITKSGHPIGNEANARYCIESDPTLKSRIVYDEFHRIISVVAPLPWDSGGKYPRPWLDLDDAEAAMHFQRLNVPLKISQVAVAAAVVAYDNKVHPVRSYLEGLAWDGVERLNLLLTDYVRAGVEWHPDVEEYRRQVGRKWMVQAIARIMQPGCQADATLVLEGIQGLGKSSMFRALGGVWYTDDMPALGTKDASDSVTSAWIIELSELSAMRKSDVESVKSFLTRRVDRFRPPYGRKTVEFPRQAVFCATCNDAEWLEDRTGGRRFYPIAASEVDVLAIQRDRDQLWAEAMTAYESGEVWYITDVVVNEVAKSEQKDRMSDDPWRHSLTELMYQDRISMNDALTAVGMPGKDRSPIHTKRIARILVDAGYIRRRSTTERYYERG
jgi:hypothetical protein